MEYGWFYRPVNDSYNGANQPKQYNLEDNKEDLATTIVTDNDNKNKNRSYNCDYPHQRK